MADEKLPLKMPEPEGLDAFLAPGSAPQRDPAAAIPSAQPAALGSAPEGLDEFVAPELAEEKYGGLGQQAVTAVEGAAEAATFGASTALETGLGLAKKEDVLARREVNPGSHMIGQAGGLIASTLIAPGAGAAGVLTKAGNVAAKAVGLGAAESIAAKIGSAAVKGFVENALFQGGDEVSKMILKDPSQSVQTAAIDIGLAGLLGGGLMGGATATGEGAKALWNATLGKQTNGVLKAITNKLGGIEGQIPDAVDDAIRASGVEIAPEIRAALMEDPFVRQSFQTLQDSATGSGVKMQEAIKDFRGTMSEAMLSSLGKTPEDIAALPLMSENKIGEQIKETLIGKLKAQSEPIEASYDKISKKFKNTVVTDDVRAEMTEAIAKSIDNGMSMESPQAKLMLRVLDEVPKLSTLEQLRNYGIGLRQETTGIAKSDLWDISAKLRRVINEGEEKVLTRVVDAEAPALIPEHRATKAAYKELKNLIGDLNDRLKVGPHGGPKTFIAALKDMDGEQVLRRLSPKGRADIIQELAKSFPEVAQQVKAFHLDQVVKNAAGRAGEGEILNSRALLRSIKGLSPEMRSFVLPNGAAAKLEAIESLLEKLPGKVGKSGTPQGLDALMSYIPASATGVATLLLGGGPAAAGLAAILTKTLGRDVPDAMRLGLLKFLGSSQPVEARGFKAMVDMIHSTMRAESKVNKAAKAIFKAGQVEVLPEAMLPDRSDREKLDKRLREAQQNPAGLMSVGGETGYYMPDHAEAIGQTTSAAVNYLNGLRPERHKDSPLDADLPSDPVAQSNYDRALDIAQQPLIVLDSIKKGNITTKDVVSLKMLYPSLYQNLSKKLMDQMVNTVSKGESIPYKTRLGLSMFLGKPLDSTMRPESILASQPSLQKRAQRAAQDMAKPTQGALKALDKLSGSYATQNQSREAKKLRD